MRSVREEVGSIAKDTSARVHAFESLAREGLGHRGRHLILEADRSRGVRRRRVLELVVERIQSNSPLRRSGRCSLRDGPGMGRVARHVVVVVACGVSDKDPLKRWLILLEKDDLSVKHDLGLRDVDGRLPDITLGPCHGVGHIANCAITVPRCRLANGWIFVRGVEKLDQVVDRESNVDQGKESAENCAHPILRIHRRVDWPEVVRRRHRRTVDVELVHELHPPSNHRLIRLGFNRRIIAYRGDLGHSATRLPQRASSLGTGARARGALLYLSARAALNLWFTAIPVYNL
mmetsp:Transcript_71405/g.201425  ORF Transcript_71405/g.201425 Transcript_71405/m.201425 type:complete len:290 (-) Transcript_71405:29-898(-)